VRHHALVAHEVREWRRRGRTNEPTTWAAAIDRIRNRIREEGGRYCRLDATTGLWTELSVQESRTKVDQAMRSRLRRIRRMERPAQTTIRVVGTLEDLTENDFRLGRGGMTMDGSLET
jgi:hypothetical protein